MATARDAARGVAWMIVTSFGSRIVGLFGTLLVTRYLAPEVLGEIAAAAVITMTAGWLSTWGFGHYAVVKGRGADALEVTWHATVAYAVVGVVGLGTVSLLAPWLAELVDAPRAASYIPGLALAAVIRRVGGTPERVLTRSLRFRPVGVATATGELAYAITTIMLAAHGWGGYAVVVGNLAQSTVATTMLIRAAGWREWATPVPLRWERFKDMLRFGVPLGIQSVTHGASRYWGALVVTRIFGSAATGVYNLAYNLADIPATYIGEQLALVLLPSMASLPPSRRARALERATALLSLIIFPLAIGLGVVAEPLIATVLPETWQSVAPVLTVLSALSVFRPITWVLSSYMEAQSRTSRTMVLEIANLGTLLLGMWALSPLGLVGAAGAVGVAFGVTATAGVLLVCRTETREPRPSVARLVSGFVRPLAACGVMAVAVLVLRRITGGELSSWPQLAIEIAGGAAAYVVAALVLCRATAYDLISLARDVVRQRHVR